MGSGFQGVTESINEPPIIGIINEDNGLLSNVATSVLYNNSKVVFNSSTLQEKQAGLDFVKQENGVALIVFNHNFTDQILSGKQATLEIYWIMKGVGLFDTYHQVSLKI